MRLGDMERVFQDGLLGRSREILTQVRGNAREDAATMFGVYQHAYWARLAESLGIDFPGLKALAGAEAFDRLARTYVARHPSVDPSIRWVGRALPQFLASEAPYRDDPWLADMARFDWALAHAFDAEDAPTAGVAALAAVPPEFWGGLKFTLHPTLDVFPVATPVDEVRPLLLANQSADASVERPAFDRQARRDGSLMVWRFEFDLKFRPIDALEAEALAAIRSGASFGEMCELIAARVPAEQAVIAAAQMLRGWLEWGVVQDVDSDAPGSAA